MRLSCRSLLRQPVATVAPAGQAYTVFGYGGKQVRDKVRSADRVAAFPAFHTAPRASAAHTIVGCRESNGSMLEATGPCERTLREIRERNGELWLERR